MRSYSQLSTLATFEERLAYLTIGGKPGIETFGHERLLNQRFYKSREWRLVRDAVIARDLGNDLGIEGFPIVRVAQVHHMNPMKPRDIIHFDEAIVDPEFLVCASHTTHNAIHYGTEPYKLDFSFERSPDDTTPWRRR